MIKQNWLISEEEKNRILNLHESATKNLYLVNEQSSQNFKNLSFNITKSFPSGKYELKDTSEIDDAIKKIQDLLSSGQGSFDTITIDSSESRVPTKNIGMNPGELSKKRAESVEKYLKSKLGDSVKIISNPLGLQGPKWEESKGANHPDYIKYQYVNLNLSAKKCEFDIDYEGVQGLPKNDYIAILPPPYKNILVGEGNLKFYTGTMPDRLIITNKRKQITQDTGYISTELYLNEIVNYIPAWVDSLTKVYNQKSSAVSGNKIIKQSVSSIDELVSLIFKEDELKVNVLNLLKQNKSIQKLLDTRTGTSEVSLGFINLLQQYRNNVREFVLYEKRTSPVEITYNANNGDNLFFVYAPIGGQGIGSTGFKIEGGCI
jgi:hypothetical protein